jgi:hypothetical protein
MTTLCDWRGLRIRRGASYGRRSSEDMRITEEKNLSDESLVSITEKRIKERKVTKKIKKGKNQSTHPGTSIQKFVEFSKAIEPEKSPSFGAGWMGVDWGYQSPVKKITKVEDKATGATWTKETGWQKPWYESKVPAGGAVIDFSNIRKQENYLVGKKYPTKITFGPDPNLLSREEVEEELRKQKLQLEQDIMSRGDETTDHWWREARDIILKEQKRLMEEHIMYGGRTVAVPNGITRGMDFSSYGNDYPTVGGKPMIANKDEAFVKSENAALLGQVALYLDQIGKNYDQLLERNERSLDEVEPCSCGNPYSQPPTPLQKVRTLNSEITGVLEILKRIVG